MKNKLLYSIFVLVLIVPTLVGYSSDFFFSGLSSATDGNTYISFINQAISGNLLMTNMYTHEPVPRLMVRPIYTLLGILSKVSGLSSISTYFIGQLLGIITFLYFATRLISLYFKNEIYRIIALTVIIFGSGFGFIFKLLTLIGIKQYGSIDLTVSDANNYLLLSSHPHTIISLALMIGSVYYFLKWFHSKNRKDIIFAALLCFIIGYEHLFDVITIYLSIGLFYIVNLLKTKKIDFVEVKHLIIFGVITFVPFIYTILIFTMVPEFSLWNSQNILTTPKLLHVIFGYGILILSYLFTFVYSLKHKINSNVLFLIVWSTVSFTLVYSPINIQRRFFEGLHVPLGIICVVFLVQIFPIYIRNLKNISSFYKKHQNLILFLLVLFVIPTNIFHFHNKIVNINNDRGSFPYQVARFLEHDEVDALIWLKDNSNGELVVTGYNIGNYVPRFMNNRVYLGHWAQTIDFDKKSKDIESYFEKISDLNVNKPYYVWYGIDENNMFPNYNPELELSYENNKVKIYKVK